MISRDKLQYPIVQSHCSWFGWYPCCNCDKEFRRERGWAFLDNSSFLPSPVEPQWRYVCKSCGPTEAAAESVAKAFLRHRMSPVYKDTGVE